MANKLLAHVATIRRTVQRANKLGADFVCDAGVWFRSVVLLAVWASHTIRSNAQAMLKRHAAVGEVAFAAVSA